MRLISFNPTSAVVSNKELILNGLDALEYASNSHCFNNLLKLLTEHVTTVHRPTYGTEVTSRVGTALLSLAAKVYQKAGEVGVVCKAPNISEFPGDFLEPPAKITATVEIRSKFNEFHCTGSAFSVIKRLFL